MLVPAGDKIMGRDGRWFSNPNPDQVIERFTADGGELVFDYEHATEIFPEDPNPAAGWIKALENRNGAIWGNVEWTDRASEMIANKEYRFISPVMWHDPVTNEVIELSSAALTHKPNLEMPALNKRGERNSKKQIENLEPMETTMDKQNRIALCSKLGLASEASDTAIMEAVNVLQEDRQKALNSASTPSLEKFVPRADHDQLKDELEKANNRIKEIDEGNIEALVDEAIKAKKIAPASREYHLAACKSNPEAFQEYVKTAPVLDITQESGLDDETIPEGGELSAEDKAMCSALGIDEAAYKSHGKKAA
jgi:phage I-like protein